MRERALGRREVTHAFAGATDAAPDASGHGSDCALGPHLQPLPQPAPVAPALVQLLEREEGFARVEIERSAQIAIGVVKPSRLEQHEGAIGERCRPLARVGCCQRARRLDGQRIVASPPSQPTGRDLLAHPAGLDDFAVVRKRGGGLALAPTVFSQPPEHRQPRPRLGRTRGRPRQ